LRRGVRQDAYVNDAFGTARRAHASTEGFTKFVSAAVASFLMQAELKPLGQLLAMPERPCIAILGGAKVSGKIGLIQPLLSKLDPLLIGGGIAYTFLKVQGVTVGNSPVGWMGVDIGPQTVESFTDAIRDAKTVVWNGPLGVFESEPFSEGTKAIALAVAASQATSIVGGRYGGRRESGGSGRADHPHPDRR
jgi:phosphoglycerate kinase